MEQYEEVVVTLKKSVMKNPVQRPLPLAED